jgi:hypothetical protein
MAAMIDMHYHNHTPVSIVFEGDKRRPRDAVAPTKRKQWTIQAVHLTDHT